MTQRIVATRRKARPRVELLEERALLSNLSISLTTDKPVYQAGQSITMTFAETNTGTTPVTVQDGPSIDGFDVTENGKLVWQSNAGNNSLVIHNVTIQPGNSFTLTKTWDVAANAAQPPILSGGTFSVTNQLDLSGPPATFQIKPAVSYAITVDNSDYHVGEPIHVTIAETNTSLMPVLAPVGPADFTVSHDGSPVWQSLVSLAPTAVQTLQPGQTITQPGTWDGVANVSSEAGDTLWGAFVVSSPEAPPAVTASFQIDDPLTTIFTAGSSAGSAAGLPITLTFTETNASGVSIKFPNLPSTFTVTNLTTGAVVFTQTDSGSSTPVSLQPGQTVARSATWVPTGNPAPTGSFSATYQDALETKSTDFQIASPPTPPPPTVPPTTPPQPVPPTTPPQPVPPTTPPQPVPPTSPPQPVPPTSPPQPVPPTSPPQPLPPTTPPSPIGTSNPPQPVPPTTPPSPVVTLPPAQPPVSATLAVIQPVHRRGHRFALTLTLKNSSNQAVAIAPPASTDGFTILNGTAVIWRSGEGKSPIRAARRSRQVKPSPSPATGTAVPTSGM